MALNMPIPPPILTGLIVEEPSCTSPLDSDLQMRKIKAQLLKAPTPRISSCSPALQERINALNEGYDPSADSSPIGAALLQRRAQRQARMSAVQGSPEEVQR